MGPLTVTLLTMTQEHPLPKLLRAGVPVTINSVRLHPRLHRPRTSAIPHLATLICRSHLPATLPQDDPLLFGPRLLDEYETCRAQLGLSDAELAQVLGLVIGLVIGYILDRLDAP